MQLPGRPDLLPEDLRDREGNPWRLSRGEAAASTDEEEGVYAIYHGTNPFGRTESTHLNPFLTFLLVLTVPTFQRLSRSQEDLRDKPINPEHGRDLPFMIERLLLMLKSQEFLELTTNFDGTSLLLSSSWYTSLSCDTCKVLLRHQMAENAGSLGTSILQ